MITGQTDLTAVEAAIVSNVGPGTLFLRNQGANTAYIGVTGLSDTTGFPLAINESVELQLGLGNTVYGICAAAETATVAYLYSRN